MKSLLTAVVLLIILSGCKKFIEQQKENYVLSAMTDGQWIITKFVNAGDTITNHFSPYSFQFNRDYTVDAIKQNVIENKGVWEGNPNTMNIMASFPNAASPVSLINGQPYLCNSLAKRYQRTKKPAPRQKIRPI